MKHTPLTLLLLILASSLAFCQESTPKGHPLTLTGYGFYDTHYASGSLGGGAP